MKKIQLMLFVALLFVAIPMLGQKNGKISVEGIARVKDVPEMVVVSVDLVIKDSLYNACFQKSLETLNRLKKVFESNGIKPETIKSKGLIVKEEFEWNKNERKLKGYSSTIELEIKDLFTPNYSEGLLKSLSEKGLDINYRIQFVFSEKQKETIRKITLEKAVADAINKATIIANAANLQLDGIASIDYNEQGEYSSYRSFDNGMTLDCITEGVGSDFNFGDVNLNPKEQNIEKIIQVEFNFNKK